MQFDLCFKVQQIKEKTVYIYFILWMGLNIFRFEWIATVYNSWSQAMAKWSNWAERDRILLTKAGDWDVWSRASVSLFKREKISTVQSCNFSREGWGINKSLLPNRHFFVWGQNINPSLISNVFSKLSLVLGLFVLWTVLPLFDWIICAWILF